MTKKSKPKSKSKIGPKEAAARAARAKNPAPKGKPTVALKKAAKAKPPAATKAKGAGLMDPAEEKALAEAQAKAAARAAKKGGAAPATVTPPKAKPAPSATEKGLAVAEKPAPALSLPKGNPAGILAGVAPAPAPVTPAKAAKATKAVKPPRDWTIKPVIKSETNKSAQQLIDRIEAASKEGKAELGKLLGSFKPCNTYYRMAHRYGTALMAAM